MRRGDFEAAWEATDHIEMPRRLRGGRVEDAGELLWDGAAFDDRHVLVRCLHGLGDTLQFIRFIPLLRQRARRVTVAIQPALRSLFPRHGEFGEVRDGWTDTPIPHEVEIEVMELAYALRITTATLPARTPYLNRRWIAERTRIEPLPASPRLRVGLVWAASSWDAKRSLPPHAFTAFAELDVDFFTLQQSADAPPMRQLHTFSCATDDVLDAAAAMLALDLVVTVDAMPAHLAGALGCPVWVLLKCDADWRWMDGRRDSPWYPSMRLFRQPRPGDWDTPLKKLVRSLRELAEMRNKPATARGTANPRRASHPMPTA